MATYAVLLASSDFVSGPAPGALTGDFRFELRVDDRAQASIVEIVSGEDRSAEQLTQQARLELAAALNGWLAQLG